MNFYRTLGRWYVQFDWADPAHGFRLAIGRWPKGETLAKLSDYRTRMADQYAADDTSPAHIECPEAHMGNVISHVGAQSFSCSHEEAPSD